MRYWTMPITSDGAVAKHMLVGGPLPVRVRWLRAMLVRLPSGVSRRYPLAISLPAGSFCLA